ncbi:MAG: RNA pseudouridine synthase [Bacteroidales bacterium]|nr:RNA pseudouridine synthase [Bacteroidales bacterium]MBN2819998.1 RNA pseudouridine synthase [Bacteroidales bacterium]
MQNKLEVLYEDNHIIAINKGNHDLVQGDITGDESLDDRVKKYIKKKHNKPGDVFLGVVHRLDRPVSGVVLFARTSKALSRLNEMFRENKVKKTYWALVKELPQNDSGTLVHYMKKISEQNKSYCYDKQVKDSKRAELEYTLKGRTESFYQLEVNLKTGRHHQIRAQLAQMGCPIKGDLKYGYPRSNNYGGIALHAYKIEFTHPVSKEQISIVAKTPKEEPLWSNLTVK